jgi:hypothetical protein
MLGRIGRQLRTQAGALRHYINWRFVKDAHESVYFYTFHKCASSLFGSYVLRNIEGLRQVDYASRIYKGRTVVNPVFESRGFIYGPLRLSLKPESPEYIGLVSLVDSPEFVCDRIAIFLLRDPRDILVSAYYSFGFTHTFSPNREIRELQQRIRREIQEQTVDEYVLDSADRFLGGFEVLHELSQACSRSVVLRYEDMIDDWERFVAGLTRYVDIREPVLREIHARSRPRVTEDLRSHRRSGMPGGFREKLAQDTIASLNRKFATVLARYQYEP